MSIYAQILGLSQGDGADVIGLIEGEEMCIRDSHKAVVPGPSAVDALGRVNTVLLSDRDLFPVGSVQLHGMKTFEKERLDVLILYGASMLVKNCVTLREIFLQIIQNNEKLLYTVAVSYTHLLCRALWAKTTRFCSTALPLNWSRTAPAASPT